MAQENQNIINYQKEMGKSNVINRVEEQPP